MRLPFRVEAEAASSSARAGLLQTLHGEVETPVFMPVGTQATVKAQTPETLEAAGARILLANTYHLLLRPGPDVFRRFGGIHRFMQWPHAVLTDSGGYQIFSLPHSRAMTEEGALFRSYVDGRNVLLSPELSIGTQVAIGSDIMMALDQCVPSTADRATALAALELTTRWAARSLDARGDSPQAIFGIVQGALFPDLRKESAERIASMPFDGLAVGGLAVGEGKAEREDTCELTVRLLPKDLPRYLMGVGTPLDILEAVHRGVDMFDCIIPTQLGKRGGVYTSRGYLQMRRGIHKHAEGPLDPGCPCPTCARYSRAYLHHLTKADEALGWMLLGQHNLHFYHRLMRDIRQHILAGTFADFHRRTRVALGEDDRDNPVASVRPKAGLSRTMGAYEVHVAREGFASIRHVDSGEIMHARTPPMDEARALYVDQSRLAQRLREPGPPIVVWDVGLGAVANAMAAILCFEQQAADVPVRAMQIVSFENDLDPLRLALRHSHAFPYVRHAGPAGILARSSWQSRTHEGLSWTLLQGDYLELMAAAPPPDIVFYDAFSAKTHGGAWTAEAFRRLRATCGDRPVELFTYTASTAARCAMLAAGFHVARGAAAGEKAETTIALTPAAVARGTNHALLGPEWLDRWSRSGSRHPADVQDTAAFDALVTSHPQFNITKEHR